MKRMLAVRILDKKNATDGLTKKRLSLAALSVAVPLLLAGCVSFGSEAPARMIDLTPEATAPAGAMGKGGLADAIIVLDPDTDQRLDVRRVPVKVDASAVAYLTDVAWVERPARLFRGLIAETLRADGTRLVFEGNDIEAGGKLLLSGRLVEMGYVADSRSAVVRYDALLEYGDGTVLSRRFEASVAGIPAKAARVGPALNTAANDVARQVAEWVAQAAPAKTTP